MKKSIEIIIAIFGILVILLFPLEMYYTKLFIADTPEEKLNIMCEFRSEVEHTEIVAWSDSCGFNVYRGYCGNIIEETSEVEILWAGGNDKYYNYKDLIPKDFTNLNSEDIAKLNELNCNILNQ